MVSSKTYPSLERVPGKQNWVDKSGGLPEYIERIAKHLHYEQGYSISRSIASAVSQVKKWIISGSPAVKAKAVKAIAQWNAKRTSAKIDNSVTDIAFAIQLAGEIEESINLSNEKMGSKSAGVTNTDKLAKAKAAFKRKKSKMSPEERKKTEARLKSSQQRLGQKVGLSTEIQLAHDLVFYENRRTPEVVAKGAEPKKSGGKAGKVKSRRPATAEEEKKIANGDWVRVDSGGRKPSDKGYKSKNKSMGPDANMSFEVDPNSTYQTYTVPVKTTDVPVDLALGARKFDESKHQRSFGGRFGNKGGAKQAGASNNSATKEEPQSFRSLLQKLQPGQSVTLPNSKVKIKKVQGGYQVWDGEHNVLVKTFDSAISRAQSFSRGGKNGNTVDPTKSGGS